MPTVAALVAVSVSMLLPVVGLVLKPAVTPLGIPDAVRVTAPVKPPVSVTVMLSVAVPPGTTESDAGVALSVKPGGVLVAIVTAMEVVSVRLPEVPVTVTVAGPVAVELAAMVTVLPLTDAVTPELELEAVRVTAPVKPLVSVTVMASAALEPCVTESVEDAGVSVKPGVLEAADATKVVMLCAGSV